MPNTRLTDPRTLTTVDPDLLMQHIAELTIELEAQDAELEAAIAAIKAEHEENTAVAREDLAQLKDRLGRWIEAHPELFVKPKTRRNNWGEYGLRQVTDLDVEDAEQLLQLIIAANETELYTTKHALDKRAILARLQEGHTIAGARIRQGDVTVCKVAKALVDAARAAATK